MVGNIFIHKINYVILKGWTENLMSIVNTLIFNYGEFCFLFHQIIRKKI